MIIFLPNYLMAMGAYVMNLVGVTCLFKKLAKSCGEHARNLAGDILR